MKTMKLSDIKIKDSFAQTTPREEKMKECRDYWNDLHKQDRFVVVNHKNELIDGYVQYLVLKENGVKDVVIKKSECKEESWRRIKKKLPYYRRNPTTYIYGIHPDSKIRKEYVWRVPDSWVGWEEDLLPGDKILVHTKRGVQPVLVTKIENSNECPVDTRVRKVFRKLL